MAPENRTIVLSSDHVGKPALYRGRVACRAGLGGA